MENIRQSKLEMENIMKDSCTLMCIVALLLLQSQSASGQFHELGLEVGFSGGGVIGLNESDYKPMKSQGRLFIGMPLKDYLQGDLGVSYVINEGSGYKTVLYAADYRFRLCPSSSEKWIPYLYAGIGLLRHDMHTKPVNLYPSVDRIAWTGVVPAGVGLQYRISDFVSWDISVGGGFTFSDDINPEQDDSPDSYAGFMVGFRFSSKAGKTDRDNDGLYKDTEKRLGTDPENPDTDQDGLNDGDEVRKYATSPTTADTDGDGLKDGEEVLTYLTDPKAFDTDKDALSDGDELMKYNTDPLKKDTDGDNLTDGDEITVYNTNALMPDTDQDGLTDGDEITHYTTNPLIADTDNGSVNDGVEVQRGSNPLDPEDDVPKVEVLEIEEEKIVLEGVTFEINSSEILPASETILIKAYNTLIEYPDLIVEIHGYTDNTGTRAYNLILSQARAESVKRWLVNRGIDASRITAKGFGPDNPIATNDTDEGRQQNRRIEFVVVE
jgi:outer membrane protein OmpA-like peptidoglycan-associated protein